MSVPKKTPKSTLTLITDLSNKTAERCHVHKDYVIPYVDVTAIVELILKEKIIPKVEEYTCAVCYVQAVGIKLMRKLHAQMDIVNESLQYIN